MVMDWGGIDQVIVIWVVVLYGYGLGWHRSGYGHLGCGAVWLWIGVA